MKTQDLTHVATLVLACGLAAACAHRPVKKDSQDVQKASSGAAPQLAAASPIETGLQEPSVRDASLVSVPELKTVYFDYDSDLLKPQARALLAANAAWLKAHAGTRVQVAGNCDQRGTIEYNLALGQRRASAVRRYYIHMGVSGKRIATISYGKERPLCAEATEACWQRNRRGESLQALTQNLSKAEAPR